MELPFNGAISTYFNDHAQPAIRDAIINGSKGDILSETYPYSRRLRRKAYQRDLRNLQIELVKMKAWARETGARIAIVFEGRDASGKGGTIKRFVEYLNPRGARIVALPTPTEVERSQWYFQRYIDHLPAGGEIVFYDRSWYNRGVVENVFDFCTPEERARFFEQTPDFEQMLVREGIHLFKIWLNVGRAEQLRRFLKREQDPLKQWKLSWIDVEGLSRWDAYTNSIEETFKRTHTRDAPWTIVRSDDKRRARLEAIRSVLIALDYARKNPDAVGTPDRRICGGPEIWDS